MQDLTQRLVNRILEKSRLTAVGISVSHRRRVVATAVGGLRRHGHGAPVTVDDRWHIGSVTKSITGFLLGSMTEAGVLDFDAPLPEILPAVPMHRAWRDCSLHHLLTHTAGLPANFPGRAQRVDPADPADLVAARGTLIAEILERAPKKPPGQAFRYSNVGYSIAGHAAEVAAGVPFEALVRERVFGPLGLQSAGFGPPRGRYPEDQPMGHRSFLGIRGAANPFDGRADNGPVISAAGRAHMHLADLVRYGDVHLAGALGDDTHLTVETWRRLHRPVSNDYAFGWIRYERDWAGGDVLWHNGSNTMWYALLVVLPKKEAVLAFVTNEGAVRKAERAFLSATMDLVAALPS
ncbi:MAG: serine hydrolase domain-containing protein [Acidobacteriota bacterium]